MPVNGFTWTEDLLRSFLLNPKAVVPKNRMLFTRIKREGEIDNLIEYLKKHFRLIARSEDETRRRVCRGCDLLKLSDLPHCSGTAAHACLLHTCFCPMIATSDPVGGQPDENADLDAGSRRAGLQEG